MQMQGWRRTCHGLDGAEYDEADHVRTEENQVIHVGDHPLGSIAETVIILRRYCFSYTSAVNITYITPKNLSNICYFPMVGNESKQIQANLHNII